MDRDALVVLDSCLHSLYGYARVLIPGASSCYIYGKGFAVTYCTPGRMGCTSLLSSLRHRDVFYRLCGLRKIIRIVLHPRIYYRITYFFCEYLAGNRSEMNLRLDSFALARISNAGSCQCFTLIIFYKYVIILLLTYLLTPTKTQHSRGRKTFQTIKRRICNVKSYLHYAPARL